MVKGFKWPGKGKLAVIELWCQWQGNGVGVNKGKWVVGRPIWRSERASALMEQLQQQINDSQREDLGPWVSREANVEAQCSLSFSRHRACNRRWTLRGGGGGGWEEQPQPNPRTASIQHQSLFCIHGEVIKASLEGIIDTHHALLGYRGVSSKVTLNS